MNGSRFLAVCAAFYLFGVALFLLRLHASDAGAEPRPSYVATAPPTVFIGGEEFTPTPPTELVGPYRPIAIATITPTPLPPSQRPPTPTPPPVPTSVVEAAAVDRERVPLTDEEMIALLSIYDWSVHEALETARCESRLRWWVVSVTGVHNGLFQVAGGSFDPAENIRQAYAKYVDGRDRRGNRWYHWNQFGGCGHFY